MKKLLPFLLCCTLSAAGAAEIKVVNRGIGGENSAGGAGRIAAVLAEVAPQVVVLGYGMNDAMNSRALIAPEAFETNLRTMIRAARDAGVREIVLNTVNPVFAPYLLLRHRYPFQEDLNERIVRYNQAVRRVADGEHCRLNDFHAALLDRGGASEGRYSLIVNRRNSDRPDGVHLTPDGYRLLGDTVADTLVGATRPGDTVLCFGDSITYGAFARGGGSAEGETYPARLRERLNTPPVPPKR